MDAFIAKHADKLQGTLSCFDRVLFRGYLPFYSGYAMASFLDSRGIRRHQVKRFVLTQAYRLKDHARQMAAREGRPYQYFGERTRKEDLARQLAERDGIQDGLVCVFAVVEPCRTFSLRWREGSAFIQSARRKCLSLYYYFMDRDLGLIHVRLQTWFPMQLQVYVNGHEWLARKLTRHGIRYTKQDNVFLWLEDFRRAQTFADRFASLGWVAVLDRYARRVNPLLRDVLAPMQYYWVTTQSEYATDLVFKRPQDLRELVPRLLTHSTLCFSATDVMSFLGRKWHGKFEGEVVTDQWGQALRGRLPGRRVKHRMKQNWLKMYDKAGLVLRVETVINQPEEFRVRRRVHRRGRRRTEWVPLRKSVAYLFRYRELSLQSNSRYLNALAQVDDPTPGLRGLDAITTRKSSASGRPAKAFNPVARPESQVFTALMSGEHAVHGFTNRALRDKLTATSLRLHPDPNRQSAQLSRLLSRLHVYGLVAKIPRSRRWRVTAFGHRVMSASVRLRQLHFPTFYAEAA
ncbi:MAG: hypothetical protein ACE5FK_06400 [Candidatus Methylomirabilia bacterium]